MFAAFVNSYACAKIQLEGVYKWLCVCASGTVVRYK